MFTCDQGHESGSGDYCDVCGKPIGAAPEQRGTEAPGTPDAARDSGSEQCDRCGASRDGRFCESCGHDSAVPVETPSRSEEDGSDRVAGGWFVVAFADREWYDAVRRRNGPDTGSVQFPPHCPQRRFTLSGARLTIGRRSRSRGAEPDIDLSGPPLDPGVSAQHATLLLREDGGWEIVDLDSTNGTTVGDELEPITPGIAVPLADGDRIRLGAWTTLRITSTAEA